MDEPEITELEKIDADRVDGVGMPANGIGFLMMKAVADPEVEKDWADWDAAHGGGGGKGAAGSKPSKAGDSKASAASAVARAKQTIADHKAGKKVSAADLKNAHDVHEAHEAHLAEEKKEGKTPAAPKPKAAPKAAAKPAAAKPAAAKPAAAKPAAKKELAKAGARDCPECGEGHDADHKGNECSACGASLPAAGDAAKAAVVKAVVDGSIDQAPDIDLGHQIMSLLAQAIEKEAQEIGAGSYGETWDVELLNGAAMMITKWLGHEESPGPVDDDSALMQSAADDGDGTGDDQIAKEGTDVDTETQTGDLTEVVKAAEAKAAVLEKRVTGQDSVIKALEDRLAKVEAAPVLGGPVMSAVRPKTAADGEDHARKAAYYEDWAERVAIPEDADRYRQLAAQERSKITS